MQERKQVRERKREIEGTPSRRAGSTRVQTKTTEPHCSSRVHTVSKRSCSLSAFWELLVSLLVLLFAHFPSHIPHSPSLLDLGRLPDRTMRGTARAPRFLDHPLELLEGEN